MHPRAAISYGVRLRVARSTQMGKPEPQESERAKLRLSRSLFLIINKIYASKWAGSGIVLTYG